MAYLEKHATAANNEDNIQRVFRARNNFNNYKNSVDTNFIQPDVHQATMKFCSSVQADRASDGKKTSTTSPKASSTKRPATSDAGKKVKFPLSLLLLP